MATKLEITLVKSPIGRPKNQRESVTTLGLRKLHQKVVLNDSPSVRGLVRTVSHLIDVKEIQE